MIDTYRTTFIRKIYKDIFIEKSFICTKISMISKFNQFNFFLEKENKSRESQIVVLICILRVSQEGNYTLLIIWRNDKRKEILKSKILCGR